MSFSDNGMMNSLYITQASQALTQMMEKKTHLHLEDKWL
jgi:hypothetical protein